MSFIYHEEIGKGSFGKVVRATRNEEEFVAKFFGYTTVDPDSNWILREIDNLYHLQGVPGVGQIHCTINDTPEGLIPGKQTSGIIFPAIVMEKLSGGELYQRIADRRCEYGERVASQIFRSFIETLRVIHDERHMINMDLKTENLVFSKPTSFDIKIIDFGMAVHLRDRKKFFGPIGKLPGTHMFLAPETIEHYDATRQGLYSKATDMWQAACILYILLVAAVPFKTKDEIRKLKFAKPIERLSMLSPNAINLLQRMFSRDPSTRLTAAEVLEHPWISNTETAIFGEEFAQDFLQMSRTVKRAMVAKDLKLEAIHRRVLDILSPMRPTLNRVVIDTIKDIFKKAAESQYGPVANPVAATAAPVVFPPAVPVDEAPPTDICLQVLLFGGIDIEIFRRQVQQHECLEFLDNEALCRELDWDYDGKINYFECLFSLPFGYKEFIKPTEEFLTNLYYSIFDIDNSATNSISLEVLKMGIEIFLQFDDVDGPAIDAVIRRHNFPSAVTRAGFIDFITECKQLGSTDRAGTRIF